MGTGGKMYLGSHRCHLQLLHVHGRRVEGPTSGPVGSGTLKPLTNRGREMEVLNQLLRKTENFKP